MLLHSLLLTHSTKRWISCRALRVSGQLESAEVMFPVGVEIVAEHVNERPPIGDGLCFSFLKSLALPTRRQSLKMRCVVSRTS